MPTVLLTAFKPYGTWPENASWLAMVELTRQMPATPRITTRLYPVDFDAARDMLARDLEEDYDVALHMGQAPGSSGIALEAIGINVGGTTDQPPETLRPLSDDGPVAYRSQLPLARWASRLREAGIPASVSYHAGTYLCNATLYWSHHLVQQMNLKTKSGFIHLPLDATQTTGESRDLPSLPAATVARALRLVLEELV